MREFILRLSLAGQESLTLVLKFLQKTLELSKHSASEKDE